MKLEKKAFYCSQNHTILLTKPSESFNSDDPLNTSVVSDKGCVPHDLIKENSKLNVIYKSTIFKNFLKSFKFEIFVSLLRYIVFNNYNFYQKTQQLGWHFDNASFAITLMIQSAETGGDLICFKRKRF